MKGSHVRHVWMTAIVVSLHVSVLSAGPREPLERAFANSARTAGEAAKAGHRRLRGLSPYEKAGGDLASQFPGAAVEFLVAKATNREDDAARGTAWITLAKLVTRKDVHDMVFERALAGEELAILSISFMPKAAMKETAGAVATQARGWRSRKDMVELLGFVGDDNSLAVLARLAKDDQHGDVRQAATKTLPRLREKLRQSAEKQAEWSECGLRCWRAIREVPKPRLLHGEFDLAAEQIAESGRKCPVAFLRCYVRSGDVLSIILSGCQREPELVGDLEVAAGSSDVLQWNVAMRSLIQIGNTEAMDALAGQMKPESVKESRRIAQLLSHYGTTEAVKLLERLIRDDRYRESWPSFTQAARNIAERLEREKPQPRSQPSANG